MKVNPLNQQQQNQKHIQVEDIKQVDMKNVSNQQVKIKLHSDDDSLEMLGDGARKETFQSVKEFTSKKAELYNLEISRDFVARHFLIMNNIKSIINDTSNTGVSFETRLENQKTIDGFTRDLKSLAGNIESRLKTDEFDPENMELDGVMSLAKMGKVTVKSRRGKNERIVIYYTGQQNRTVEVDLDKNTGEIGILLGENQDQVTNQAIKTILEEAGYETIVEPKDLGQPFLAKLAQEVKAGESETDNFTRSQAQISESSQIKVSNQPSRTAGQESRESFRFKISPELVGLSVMTDQDIQTSIEKMDCALKSIEVSNKKLEEKKDELSIDLGRYYASPFGQGKIQNFDQAQDKVRDLQENMQDDRNYIRYLERIQDPALVYKLLK